MRRAVFFLGDPPGIRAVGIGNPEIFAAVPIADESDLAAIGREYRLRLEGIACKNRARLPAFRGKRVDVAQQIEQNGAPIG
ncbi:hypothetical protein [Novosphingobium sp. PhB57]|uniref:hypothetical protein n=1 Tax=Novosphingobium sp. PhB57 TaxID=2485107 RepID=UPI001FB52075|nr:hypothetical protein [Novosphingobium sp. PhB57]